MITSLQVQDLINCFPDEDSHLKKFLLASPYSHDSGWVTGLVAVPLLQTGKEWASSVSVYVHVHACIHSDFEQLGRVWKLLIIGDECRAKYEASRLSCEHYADGCVCVHACVYMHASMRVLMCMQSFQYQKAGHCALTLPPSVA